MGSVVGEKEGTQHGTILTNKDCACPSVYCGMVWGWPIEGGWDSEAVLVKLQ